VRGPPRSMSSMSPRRTSFTPSRDPRRGPRQAHPGREADGPGAGAMPRNDRRGDGGGRPAGRRAQHGFDARWRWRR
jgi:hypothetical protein